MRGIRVRAAQNDEGYKDVRLKFGKQRGRELRLRIVLLHRRQLRHQLHAVVACYACAVACCTARLQVTCTACVVYCVMRCRPCAPWACDVKALNLPLEFLALGLLLLSAQCVCVCV